MAHRTCSKVASSDCQRPAGLRTGGGGIILDPEPKGPIFTCWACGDDVCGACSSLVTKKVEVKSRRSLNYHRRTKVRVCFDCQRKD